MIRHAVLHLKNKYIKAQMAVKLAMSNIYLTKIAALNRVASNVAIISGTFRWSQQILLKTYCWQLKVV